MKVFLTGGTGFIGQPLTRKLIERGWEVTALARNPNSIQSKAIQSMGAKLVQGDVTECESMRDAMRGADAVIHNAAWYEFGVTKAALDRMHAINVQGTKNTLELALELGIPKIVYTSTMLVFGETGDVIADETFHRRVPPKSAYEQTKTEAHAYVRQLQETGAPIVIVCPARVIGAGDPSNTGYLARMYVRGFLPPVLFARDGHIASVHVEDTAEGIVRCVERGRIGETYILSNGNMRHKDTFDLWKQTPGGFKTTLFYMPKWMAILFNQTAEVFERLFGLPRVFGYEFAQAAFANWQFTAAKAEQELGMKFRSIEEVWLDVLAAERAALAAGTH